MFIVDSKIKVDYKQSWEGWTCFPSYVYVDMLYIHLTCLFKTFNKTDYLQQYYWKHIFCI